VGQDVTGAWRQERLDQQLAALRFARPGVVAQGNGVPIGLAVHAQVGALGQCAAQQAVGVLVDAARSQAVLVRKAHRNAEGLRQRLVVRCLTPYVVRHAQAYGRIESVEHKASAARSSASEIARASSFKIWQRSSALGMAQSAV